MVHLTKIERIISGGLLIQITAVLAVIILIRLTLKWNKMMNQIELHERLLPVLQKPQQIFKKINRVVLFFVIFGISKYFGFKSTYLIANLGKIIIILN